MLQGKMILYVYLRHSCWLLNWVKPDGLPDLFRFKSVGWIILEKGDRALLSRDKLAGATTAATVPPRVALTWAGEPPDPWAHPSVAWGGSFCVDLAI